MNFMDSTGVFYEIHNSANHNYVSTPKDGTTTLERSNHFIELKKRCRTMLTNRLVI